MDDRWSWVYLSQAPFGWSRKKKCFRTWRDEDADVSEVDVHDYEDDPADDDDVVRSRFFYFTDKCQSLIIVVNDVAAKGKFSGCIIF